MATIISTKRSAPTRRSTSSQTPHSSRTLTVNPAFLQEIKDSNPDLWHLVHELRQTCHSSDQPATLTRKLVRQLDDLRDAIALQFALEESYGFLEVPTSMGTVIDELSAKAHGQHCQLYLQLSELAEQAEELQYRGVAIDRFHDLVRATEAFDQQLREHEALESRLIEHCLVR